MCLWSSLLSDVYGLGEMARFRFTRLPAVRSVLCLHATLNWPWEVLEWSGRPDWTRVIITWRTYARPIVCVLECTMAPLQISTNSVEMPELGPVDIRFPHIAPDLATSTIPRNLLLQTTSLSSRWPLLTGKVPPAFLPNSVGPDDFVSCFKLLHSVFIRLSPG
ncbi:unnamed protein product [Protopolystoma xenopodis]|uniref:Uncharacterized protein n=1 Tax=Protopolystoma xenopodis TaxID=117903 RepID=A0A3S5CE60_9PLAT|nr:unnamed protein product [Protopolystoma xenopodis]